jgi:hypothetical protein
MCHLIVDNEGRSVEGIAYPPRMPEPEIVEPPKPEKKPSLIKRLQKVFGRE